jgi:Mycothiol maleylpyruvate isomerase N-terminal domain
MDREQLLQREDTAWSALVDAFAAIPDGRRDVEGAVPGWSVKDLVWHCGYWADYVGDVLERMGAGQPEPPDQDWDELNRLVIEDGRGMTWDEVIVAAERGRDRARSALIAMSQVTEPAESEFADETYQHYEEHAAEIRSFASTG